MTGWTEERLTRAEALWRGGHMSARDIAADIGGGLTRNAIIGKAHRGKWGERPRIGRQGQGRPPKADRPKSHKQTIRKPPRPVERNYSLGFGSRFQSEVPVPPTPVIEPPTPPVARMVSLMDLKFGDCRFPLGDPRHADFGYCGAKAAPGRSYCDWHAQLAYQPVQTRRQREAAHA